MLKWIITAFFIPLLVYSWAQRRLNLDNYVLVWGDEFNYTDTSQLYDNSKGLAKWKKGFPYDDLRGIDHNPIERSCSELATNRFVTVENGLLKMGANTLYNRGYIDSVLHQGQYWRSQRQSAVLTAVYDRDYPCAQGEKQWLKGFAYGIFEIRAKLPNVSGDYPAFWLWGDPYQPCTNGASVYSCLPFQRADTLPCPPQGFCPGFEIDVFEAKYTQESWQKSPVQHFWATVQANGYQNPACFPCATNYKFDVSNPQDNFHTYSLAWTPQSVTWFIDGNEIRTQNGGIPFAKLNLILSHSTFANGKGGVMEVDYVRVYRPKTVDYQPHYSEYRADSLLWDWPDTNVPAFRDYINAYAQNDYFQANYSYQSTGFNSRTGANIAQAALLEQGQNSRLIYLLAGNKGENVPFLRTLRTFPNGESPVYTSIIDTLANNADNSCPIVAYNLPRRDSFIVFYKSTDKKIWQVGVDFNGKKTAAQLSVGNGDNYSVKDNLIHYSTTGLQSTFFAFRDDKKRLNLLIYHRRTKHYLHYQSEIIVYNPNLTLLNAQTLLYSDKKGHLQRVDLPLFDTVSAKNGLNLTPTRVFEPIKKRKKGDCFQQIIANPLKNGFFYPNKANQLVAVDLNTKEKTFLPARDVAGTVVIRPILNRKDSLIELFYIADNGKIKTLYERSTYSGALGEFMQSTLDVFSAEGDYRLGNFISLAKNSKDIFVLHAQKRCIGRYRQRQNNQLPPLFYDCNNDDTYQVGLQF